MQNTILGTYKVNQNINWDDLEKIYLNMYVLHVRLIYMIFAYSK